MYVKVVSIFKQQASTLDDPQGFKLTPLLLILFVNYTGKFDKPLKILLLSMTLTAADKTKGNVKNYEDTLSSR